MAEDPLTLQQMVDAAVESQLREVLRSKDFAKSLRRLVLRSLKQNSRRMIGPPDRVVIDPSAVVKDAMFNTMSGTITVGADAGIADDVRLLTGTHDISKTGAARLETIPTSGRDIEIQRGAWIATGAVIIGPCVVGEDSVVAAGAVVTRDVPAQAIVAGNPAQVLGTVGPEGERPERSTGRSRTSS